MSVLDNIGNMMSDRIASFGDSQTVCSELRSLKLVKPSIISVIIVLIVAAAVGGFINFSQATRTDTNGWTKIDGTVSYEDDTSTSTSNRNYVEVVSYTVDGQKYSVKSSVASSNLPVISNSNATVLYNPNDPSKAVIASDKGNISFMNIAIYVFLLIVVLLIIFSFVRAILRKKQIDRLKSTGKQITGRLTGIISNRYGQSGSNTNGTPTGDRRIIYKLVASAQTEDHQVVDYQGKDGFYGSFGLQMANYQNLVIYVKVFVDQNNPKNFYIDPSTATTDNAQPSPNGSSAQPEPGALGV